MASIETSATEKSADVRLNIVPFIDLMSCLTAFLLVTAAWTQMSQIDVEPKGIGRSGPPGHNEPVVASVLVEDSSIWVGLSRINKFQRIPRRGVEHDWAGLGDVLRQYKAMSYFQDRHDIEIAADNQVSYQHLIAAMDVAISVGFDDVGLADPASLSAQPRL